MKEICCFIFIIVLLFSCKGPEKNPPPPGLLGEQKFIEVLTDMRLLEGAYTTRHPKVDTSDYGIPSYYLTLFARHGVTGENYRLSYAYYSKNHSKMIAFEDSVTLRLNSMQAVEDSLNRDINIQSLDTMGNKNPVVVPQP